MKEEKEIKDRIEEAKELWDKNPDFWQGYREALEWVLDIHFNVVGCQVYGQTNLGLKIEEG